MRRDHHAMPFLAVAAGIATFSVMDGVMKSASIAVGAYSAMLFRSLIGAGLMLPIWRLGGGRWPRGDTMRLHALRGALSAGLATTFFWALVRLPLAEAIALSFVAPLIALYLAAVMLGERIEMRSIAGSLIGFAGVLVIAAARLTGKAYTVEAAWGIGAIMISAVLYAFNLVLMRKQAQVASPQEVTLFQAGFAALWLGLAAPWLVVWPDRTALGYIGGGAMLAVISLLLISWGYARAEAQRLLPLEYTAFVWASVVGWFMFGEGLTGWTIAGVGLIVIGCLIAARKPTEQTAL